MPLISVIVPIYNVEKHLRRCIDSIREQTLSDIEIILVDDGSTDSSGAICDDLSLVDKRIRVIHKPNGGLSSARNVGIDSSTAGLIGFVDSDDFIARDMYETLYRNLINHDADMSMCGLFDCYEGEEPRVVSPTEILELNSEEAIEIVFEAKITSVTAVNKLYKKSLFDEVRYPIGKTSEDAFVIVDLLLQCKRIVLDTSQKYYYMHRSGSITSSAFKPRDLQAIEAYEKNFAIIERDLPNLLPTAKMRLMWAHFYVLDKMMIATDTNSYSDVMNEIIAVLRSNYLFIVRDRRFNASRKVALTLLMVSKRLYKLCAQMARKKYY